MQLVPSGLDKVEALVAKGVAMPNPWMVTIDDDVDIDRISGDGVTIHPGARIRGARTVVSAGVELGREGPVTIEDCALGLGVQLKGGYAAKAVFLDGANMGLGHHVREGSILEEEANGAHTVGLKQTILFPFVTLGSLINMCDCLVAGGTSRSDHSEVGSSYIHFNFTPTGDKATPSLFGDVARGVMLREQRIFLGGQGGTVGPARVAYGTVVGAGETVRQDIRDENRLVLPGHPGAQTQEFEPTRIRGAARLVARNVEYLAALDALDRWYRVARQPFFEAADLGKFVYAEALRALASAREERAKRLGSLIRKLIGGVEAEAQLLGAVNQLAVADVGDVPGAGEVPEAPETLVRGLRDGLADHKGYIVAVQRLTDGVADAATSWLRDVAAVRVAAAREAAPALATKLD